MTVALVIAVAFVIFFWQYRSQLEESYQYFGRVAAPVRVQLTRIPASFKLILTKYFRYYNELSPADKLKFERKLCHLIFSKQFIPRNFEAVTDEMKVLIAASAVQLTFGLPKVTLSHFNKVLIYPDDYYSSITKRYHKGEVNPAFGIIVLSWQSFVEGYLIKTEEANLGIHEMAHALRLENVIRNEEFQFFDEELLSRLDMWGRKVCEAIEHQQLTIFRPYACTNTHEFFAVAVENFFERPNEFKEQLPELYWILATLLNQEPLRLAA
jgi:hypothetical protein